jgi:hypothetical protein
MARLDRSPWSLRAIWDTMNSPTLSDEEKAHQKLLMELYSAIQHRLDPPPPEEAHWWMKGILLNDRPDGTSSTVPCWTSKFEYQAWHRIRFPGTYPVF